MDARRLVEALVTEVAPNATVAAIDERGEQCRVTLAGTTGVVAGCEIPRALIEGAGHSDSDRAQLAAALKRCADDVVAPLPDGRS
jgi:hypothetical protein